ncbi:hypothetical protein M501DRAFT_743351 [Patellaria atrata CBS 101060]|uniref:Thioesterase domain-containing protein n=1 Tax=Patellaria atrata CBS 101060 TaxID=1346257 RepID=A0A9P4SBZ8_9PEZI|nr:hypothetical protein M501DRAFT_743351 [Patellaria atrata CBS 101060]
MYNFISTHSRQQWSLRSHLVTPLFGRSYHVHSSRRREATEIFNEPAKTINYRASKHARSSRRPILYAAIFFVLGIAIGRTVNPFLSPTPLPLLDSPEERLLSKSSSKAIDALPIIQELRSSISPNPNDSKALYSNVEREKFSSGRYAGFVEILPGHGQAVSRTFTRKSLAGSNKVGQTRTFFNPSTKEVIAVIWFGTLVSGWPTITHGGVIATIMQDNMTKVLTGLKNLEDIREPSTLSITYLAPTWSNNFFVLRAKLGASEPSQKESDVGQRPEPSKDLTKEIQNQPNFFKPTIRLQTSATLETLDGKICVKSKALWEICDIPEHIREDLLTSPIPIVR